MLKNFLLILIIILYMWRAMVFSGFASLAKSRWWLLVSALGAWQKLHLTPRAALNASIVLSRSSWLMSFGRTLRFLFGGLSSAGRMADIPITIRAAKMATTANFL